LEKSNLKVERSNIMKMAMRERSFLPRLEEQNGNYMAFGFGKMCTVRKIRRI